MTPADDLLPALVEHIRMKFSPFSEDWTVEEVARDVLAFVAERLPTSETAAMLLEAAYGDSFSPEGRAAHEEAAGALLRDLRGRLGVGT